jgi:Zn finger protein HypA/HybF involved in hydrogenase expression
MHELSVALEVCRLAEERLGPECTPRLRTIAVRVGDRWGLEPANLAFCLDALLSAPPFGRASARIERCEGDVLQLEYLEVDDGDPNDLGT